MRTRAALLLTSLLLLAPTDGHAGKPSGGGGKGSCGDGNAKGKEQCDGADLRGTTCQSLGFDSGELACDASCAFDTSSCTTASAGACGDGTVDGYEECDGADDAACPGRCSAHCACPAVGAAAELEVHVLDVGQGDGIIVISPDGFVLMVDSGTQSQSATIKQYLGNLGISDIDYTLVSHLHADHFGAIDAVLTDFPSAVACFDNGEQGTTNEYQDYVAAAASRRTTVNSNDVIDLGPSMTAEVLHASDGASNENDNSVVLRLTYGSTRILLGGDCEANCETAFDPGRIEIYKVHHHGSTTSSTAGFLDRMQPEVGVISAGDGNAFGHPANSTLDALAARNVTVFRTDVDGDVVVLSDGNGYMVNGASACSDGEQRACGNSNIGLCSYGTQSCVNGQWDTCLGAVGPTSEDCNNGFDDDCDGLTDTADADCGGAMGHVVLAQVAYDTPGADSAEEFIELYNPTSSQVSTLR